MYWNARHHVLTSPSPTVQITAAANVDSLGQYLYRMQTAQSTLIRQPEVARIKLPERNGDPEKNLCPSIGPRLASKRSGLGVNARADLSMLEPFLVNVENDGEQDATDFRLDVDFPVAFLDESGHVLRVSSIQPGVAR